MTNESHGHGLVGGQCEAGLDGRAESAACGRGQLGLEDGVAQRRASDGGIGALESPQGRAGSDVAEKHGGGWERCHSDVVSSLRGPKKKARVLRHWRTDVPNWPL